MTSSTVPTDSASAVFAAQRTQARALYARARGSLAGGVGHDLRYNDVAPTYITHARGAYKWDVDGNAYIDYGMGNAALLLGHAHPDVVAAVQAAATDGLHFGNDHPAMLEWSELIQQLMPSAERIRFVNSGSEGTMLALRLARAFSGRERVLRLEGHFSGWHDSVGKGAAVPFDRAVSLGIPTATLDTIVVVPADLARIEATLAHDPTIAALMLEPSGASWGTVPLSHAFNRQLRDLTRRHGVLLIYDEVITGFRYSPGGYQGLIGVKPDLTVLGKVVAGGMPGGAVVGRADVMQLFDYTGDAQHDRHGRVAHQGTFNASPLSAAAGIVTLRLVADGSVQAHADRLADSLRQGMQAAVDRLGVNALVYGDSSMFHVYIAAEPRPAGRAPRLSELDAAALKGIPLSIVSAFQRNLQIRGVDVLSSTGGVTSAAHTDADIERTVVAFDAALQALQNDGFISGRNV